MQSASIIKSLFSINDATYPIPSNTDFLAFLQDILYIIAINKQFPTLHHHISLDKLYDFYKSYPKIWQELMTYPTVSNELPMCQTIIPGE